MTRSISCRVARGVELLNRRVPDWAERVNPDTLNLVHLDRCVLGQLFGNYGEGVLRLNLESRETGDEAVECGFFCEKNDEWDLLQLVWVRAINGRLATRARTISTREPACAT